ncbi:MAG TPA: 1-deoxy-D-xylulose-5-phosphate reductoisomerase, partial [Nevskiaceae bacterium]|nr:1-deoxy-D-xylulose-5-phosphate reductoisomerase [Nevskiaceae bacterium]
ANEIAVEAFLKGALGFMGIPELVERCCDAAIGAILAPPKDLEAVLEVDAWARRFCAARLNEA